MIETLSETQSLSNQSDAFSFLYKHGNAGFNHETSLNADELPPVLLLIEPLGKMFSDIVGYR